MISAFSSQWSQDSAVPRCFPHKLFTPYCSSTADHSCSLRVGACTFFFLTCVSFIQALCPGHLNSTLPFCDTLAVVPSFETCVLSYLALHIKWIVGKWGLQERRCDQQVRGGGSAPLPCCGETPSGVCIQLWGPQLRKNMDLLK